MNNNTKAGLELLNFSQNYDPLIPVIMMSGHGNIETAMKAAKNGAFDFIEKPFKAERLILLIEKALIDRNLKLKVLDFELKENERMTLIGNSATFKYIKQNLNKIAPTNSRVLITGPSGSGKELIARWIHKNSNRKSFPFIIASCATLSPERVEQVLFGWNDTTSDEDGNQSNVGLFEQANNGTLFFDEICDLPLQTQGKLVQAIQDQSFYKIGSNKKINVDVRIISASNNNLTEFIKNGTLREDLFYRLSVAPIEVPPLNKRGEDIVDLIFHFLNLLAKDFGNNTLKLASETLLILKSYDWPGNVRELSNMVHRLSVLYPGQILTLQSIDKAMLPQGMAEIAEREHGQDLDVLSGESGPSDTTQFEEENEVESIIMQAQGYDQFRRQGSGLKEMLGEIEKDIIVKALDDMNGNVSKCAKILSMQRTTLIERIKRYELKAEK